MDDDDFGDFSGGDPQTAAPLPEDLPNLDNRCAPSTTTEEATTSFMPIEVTSNGSVHAPGTTAETSQQAEAASSSPAMHTNADDDDDEFGDFGDFTSTSATSTIPFPVPPASHAAAPTIHFPAPPAMQAPAAPAPSTPPLTPPQPPPVTEDPNILQLHGDEFLQRVQFVFSSLAPASRMDPLAGQQDEQVIIGQLRHRLLPPGAEPGSILYYNGIPLALLHGTLGSGVPSKAALLGHAFQPTVRLGQGLQWRGSDSEVRLLKALGLWDIARQAYSADAAVTVAAAAAAPKPPRPTGDSVVNGAPGSRQQTASGALHDHRNSFALDNTSSGASSMLDLAAAIGAAAGNGMLGASSGGSASQETQKLGGLGSAGLSRLGAAESGSQGGTAGLMPAGVDRQQGKEQQQQQLGMPGLRVPPSQLLLMSALGKAGAAATGVSTASNGVMSQEGWPSRPAARSGAAPPTEQGQDGVPSSSIKPQDAGPKLSSAQQQRAEQQPARQQAQQQQQHSVASAVA
eukprot:CAMPEP_0202904894 /NCGR_PEP_ID=MMETSP1392-20130828/31684_1 /ASSEMBLY_ACC=CAM_ASM_000868 /TAXON_ID=225041 /ORGANISM="Chlamydomonas chlamydogama, Strain SAG 11-48b" /LENGTH=513 /DNA_ID=CAMNT_0049592759 /DNA_START=192 /DNA_END=1730 /DNA_ORIENTATION=+